MNEDLIFAIIFLAQGFFFGYSYTILFDLSDNEREAIDLVNSRFISRVENWENRLNKSNLMYIVKSGGYSNIFPNLSPIYDLLKEYKKGVEDARNENGCRDHDSIRHI